MFQTNWIEVFDVVIRALLSLLTLFLVTKMLGKKQVSQLSLFDYVIGISIGNFAAEMTINTDSQYMNGIAAVVIFGVLAYFVSIMTMKSIYMRRYFMGTPTLLIERGKLMEAALRKVKFDINDLLEECRGNGYFDISQIEYAIMEANGKVSILPKADCQPVSVKDMSLKVQSVGLCANVVIDGKVMVKNLAGIKRSEKWLKQQLKVKGYDDLADILLATVDVNEKVVVYDKNAQEKPSEVLE